MSNEFQVDPTSLPRDLLNKLTNTSPNNDWRTQQGLPPIVKQGSNRRVRQVYLSDDAYNTLLSYAEHYNLRSLRGPNAHQPSVSQLLEALGSGQATIEWKG